MDEKILIIDFDTNPDILKQISWSLRKLKCFTKIISSKNLINFSSDIIGIILIGTNKNKLYPNFNLNNINIPILGILNGCIIIAQSYNCQIGKRLSISKNKIQNWISYKEISNPLLIGCDKCHYIDMNEFHVINGSNINVLGFNQLCGQTIYQIKNKPHYGIQFIPKVKSLIWRNFLYLCHNKSLWTHQYICNYIIQILLNNYKNENIYLFYEGDLKSMILLKLCIKHNIKFNILIINHGLYKLDEYESIIEDINSLGLNLNVMDVKDDFYRIMSSNHENKLLLLKSITKNNLLEKGIHKIIVTNYCFDNSDYSFNPFMNILDEELKSLGQYLGISNRIIEKHISSWFGLADRFHNSIFTLEKFRLLQKLDYLWLSYLKSEYYYQQFYQSGISFLTDNILTIWIKNDKDEYEVIPSHIIMKILPTLKKDIGPNMIITYHL